MTYSFNREFREKQFNPFKGRGGNPVESIFVAPQSEPPVPVTGRYQLQITGYTFEPEAELEVELVLHGQVHGWFGTDSNRRDLTVALLWGAPVALAFGFLGAIATTITTMIIAALGAWQGGWVDALIQRITEINMLLPALPIAIMVFYVYSKSIWAILGVMVVLNIFSSQIKNYRAMFLQVKGSPYIEAARMYGAGSGRIILHYLVPRILPVLIPQIVSLVPSYVFLEATLAYLGVSDIYLPTWGKVVSEALSIGALRGNYHWILEPIGLLMLTGLGFVMLGFSLDRIFNPRLRAV
jgi:peptide/nickel transport system permease protein